MADKKKKARKQYAKTDDGKRERFRDFAAVRVTRALRSLRAVGKLGGRAYISTAEQREKCLKALVAELNRCESALKGAAPAEDTFTV